MTSPSSMLLIGNRLSAAMSQCCASEPADEDRVCVGVLDDDREALAVVVSHIGKSLQIARRVVEAANEGGSTKRLSTSPKFASKRPRGRRPFCSRAGIMPAFIPQTTSRAIWVFATSSVMTASGLRMRALRVFRRSVASSHPAKIGNPRMKEKSGNEDPRTEGKRTSACRALAAHQVGKL